LQDVFLWKALNNEKTFLKLSINFEKAQTPYILNNMCNVNLMKFKVIKILGRFIPICCFKFKFQLRNLKNFPHYIFSLSLSSSFGCVYVFEHVMWIF
jgi:hypothetical protein